MADSTGDPDADAVLGHIAANSQVASTGDPDVDAVLHQHAKAEEELPIHELESRADQLGQEPADFSALPHPLATLGRSAVGAATNLANMIPFAGGGIADAIRRHTQSIQPQNVGEEIGAGGISATLPLLAMGAGAKAKTAMAAPAESPHPLAAAAEAEAQRIQQMHAQGTAAGLDLPIGASTSRAAKAAANNQPLSNSMARQELNLPANSPLTPQLLTKARQQFASPGYEAVKAIPDPIPLGAEEQAALNDVRPLVGGRITLPDSDTMTGQQAVDLSKKLRARAAQLDKAQGITASGDIPSDLADAHRDAAEAIENATKRHLESTGRADLAKNWDDARVYTAKTYSVQDALDGAGNVNVSKLKQQILKGKPLSGNLETLANLGARFPNALKLTPESAPVPGLARRAAAFGATPLGTLAGEAIGSSVGAPGLGSAIGSAAGRAASDKILQP